MEHDYIFEEIQELSDQDLNSIRLPFIMKDKILMSPGVWNSFYYSSSVLKEAFDQTDWNSKEARSLFLDHEDTRSREWIGEVDNVRVNGDDIIGDLVIVDKATAIKLAFGAKMGVSPKIHGPAEGNALQRFVFDNFSVVINPAVKTAWINNMESFLLDTLDETIDIYKSFLEAEEVTEKMSKYTDFVKKYIKDNPDIPVAEAMKRAAKEWKKVKGGKKMGEEEIQDVPQEMAKKKKPEEEEMAKKKKPEEEEKLSDIKIMLEHILEELQKKKEYPYPYKKKKMDEEEIEEEEMAKKKKPEEEEMKKKKKPEEEEEEMVKKKYPYPYKEKKMEEDIINEMSQKIEGLQEEVKKLTIKLNEPNKVSVKQELSQNDPDLEMLGILNAL